MLEQGIVLPLGKPFKSALLLTAFFADFLMERLNSIF